MDKQGHAILWIPLAIITIAVLAYASKFSGSVSSDPFKWAAFGHYLGGVLTPAIGFATLCAMMYLALHARQLENTRKAENSHPVGLIRCADYETDIQVFLENAGVGPLRIDEFTIIQKGSPVAKKNLVELMPTTPKGLRWRFFTLGGPPPYLHPNTQAMLLHLQGKEGDAVFTKYRDEVREKMNEIEIKLEYSNIYGESQPAATRKLNEVFGRHQA